VMDSWFRCEQNGARCVAQTWPADRFWKCRSNEGASWKRILFSPENTVKKVESSPLYNPLHFSRVTWIVQNQLQVDSLFLDRFWQTGTLRNSNGAPPAPGGIFTTKTR
jgi:hypothetical protein